MENNIEAILRAKVNEINKSSDKKKLLSEWIHDYPMKIVSLKTEEGSFHIVFKKNEASMRKGDYSSCEFTYIGSSTVIKNILEGNESAGKAGMKGIIKGWGSVNEALQFEKLLR